MSRSQRRTISWLAATTALVLIAAAARGRFAISPPALAQDSPEDDPMATERIHAPELKGGVSWLNTDKPVTLAALKGKIVLLDFWTYC